MISIVGDCAALPVAPTVSRHLAAGGVIAYPTESVYGLGCLATERGLDALVGLKPRATESPFLILVSGLEMLHDIGLRLESIPARRLAASFWPGSLTLVLQGGDRLPQRLRGEGGGVAVRWPGHRSLVAMIESAGSPITSTSANLPGGVPAKSAPEVLTIFGEGGIDSRLLVLDGGTLKPGAPSTIVDCSTDSAVIIREGAVSAREISTCLAGELE